MKLFSCVETITIHMSEQISSNSFDNEFTDKLSTQKLYMNIGLRHYQQNVFKNHIYLI